MIRPGNIADILIVTASPRPMDVVALTSFSATPDDRHATCMRIAQSSFAIYAQEIRGVGVVGVCGFMEKWPGCIYAWAFATDKARPREWYRFLKPTIDAAISGEVRRIECTAIDGFPEARRTLEHLGFKHEGTEECSGINGESRHYYARLKP